MVRGCKKSIIYIKNTGSDIFKEAYFILSEGKGVSVLAEEDMICEANRIIEEKMGRDKASGKGPGRSRGFLPFIRKYLLSFVLGSAFAAAIFSLFLII